MSKWCDTCSRNKITGEWKSCGRDCPAFGKHHEELAEMVIKQKEEINALRQTNKQLVKIEKKKRIALWNKAVNQFMNELKNKWSYVPNLSIDGKEVVDVEDIEIVAKEMINHIKE